MGLRSQRVLALLAYLVVEAHRPHHRTSLAALLWPDKPETKAMQNMRQTLSRLRHAIDDAQADPPHLLADAHQVQFNRASDYWFDVEAFRAILKGTEHHRHRRLDACRECMSELTLASGYYRGDFLAGLHVTGSSMALDEWLLMERERLGQQACAVLQAVTSSNLAHGQPETARRHAQQLLRLDPWNEAAQRLMLRALAASEGRNAALRHYQAFRQTLAGELGVAPEDSTQALVEQIRADTGTEVLGHKLVGLLPAPATRFIRRDAVQDRVCDYLSSRDQRLVTLYGPGGSGKTRLALEIAAEQAPLWQDGVWFIPLADVLEPEGIVNALAEALDLKPEPGSPPPEQLMEFLRPKELLLILDSFEHLAAAAPLLQDILRSALQVKVLVTSLSRLGLRSEWALEVLGLEVPPKPPATMVEALQYGAVQLFMQNARKAAPGVDLTEECLPHVVRICQMVAGLPLGIELAAAWVRLYPCRRIATEIAHSLDFLHHPGAGAPERQHSLRATFEYSYRLLTSTERELFRKLSVFRGGFSADAARQVAEADAGHLASLADSSLLRTSTSGRLDAHSTVRQYASEKLGEHPEEQQQVRERHSRFYHAFMQDREEELNSEQAKNASDEISVEMANVRAAWQWAAGQGRVSAIEATIPSLSLYYMNRALYQEAGSVFRSAANQLLTRSRDSEAQRVGCRLLARQAESLQRQGLYPQVAEVAQTMSELAESTGDVLCEARGLMYSGAALWNRDDSVTARTQLQRALSLVQSMEDGSAPELAQQILSLKGSCLNLLAGACWRQGDHAGAEAYLEKLLSLFSHSGNRKQEAAALGNLGVVAMEQEKYAEAILYYQRALGVQRELGWRKGAAFSNLGEIYLKLGDYAAAERFLQQALTIDQEAGAHKSVALVLGGLGLLAHRRGQGELALEQCQQALRISEELDNQSMQGDMWLRLGHALLGLNRLEEAAAAYANSLDLRRELGRANLATESLAGLARVALAQGRTAQAQERVEEILTHLEAAIPVSGSRYALDGTASPCEVYLTCYRVLVASQDPRAQDVLDTAYHLLHKWAANISDEALRSSFLDNVAAHREIMQAWMSRE